METLPNIIVKHSGKLAILWALIILALCGMPGEYIPSQDWMDILSLDKFVHAFIFFVLFTLITISAVKNNFSIKVVYLFFVVSVLYGIVLEVLQTIIFRNRATDYKDMLANAFGCLLALLLMSSVKRMVQRRQNIY